MSDIVLRKYLITVQGEPHSLDALEERLLESLDEAKEEDGLSRATLKQVSELAIDENGEDEDLDDDTIVDEDEEAEADG